MFNWLLRIRSSISNKDGRYLCSSNCPHRLCTPHCLLLTGYREEIGWRLKPITHLYQMPRLRMCWGFISASHMLERHRGCIRVMLQLRMLRSETFLAWRTPRPSAPEKNCSCAFWAVTILCVSVLACLYLPFVVDIFVVFLCSQSDKTCALYGD